MSENDIVLEPLGDGVFLARWPRRRYRFMFDDGTTLDVESHTDSSTLRGVVVDAMSSDRKKAVNIVGVADITRAPVPPARKRRPK